MRGSLYKYGELNPPCITYTSKPFAPQNLHVDKQKGANVCALACGWHLPVLLQKMLPILAHTLDISNGANMLYFFGKYATIYERPLRNILKQSNYVS